MLDWYARIIQGDLGHSILLNRSVTAAIIERLPVTLSLAGLALVIRARHGRRRRQWPRPSITIAGPIRLVMTLALFGLSVPDFWLGIMLILLFAVKLGFFPTGGYVPFSEDPIGWAGTIVMPALTLAIIQVGFVARMTRASMLEILNQDFIRTADAKGLKRAEIMLRHGLPNALIPILTVGGIVAGALLGGAVIIEQVFSIPGVGRLIIGGISARDYPGHPRWPAVSGGHLSDSQSDRGHSLRRRDPRVRLE